MHFNIHPDWEAILRPEMEMPYFQDLLKFVEEEYKYKTIFPPKAFVFNALNHARPEEVKVVILGQDPYHGPGQAHGLSFSVPDGIAFPPSLRNIFKEIQRDLGISAPFSGNLERWADQGVLLLNATLTVRASLAGSHQKKGWEEFTDAIIHRLAEDSENLVFMLWGSHAQKKGQFIDERRHLVLKAPHPSPLSAHRGFIGCGHFSQANEYLESKRKGGIDW
ncbi:uracil-DNA glycosylase [Litoribacter ruber]|uniref:Uracil-DNA glycosylase n=1 Tax=Litoribacter ruber TaxID=702568 RepID=A0AAP2CII8_9BACT|nr:MULTISPECIES: uracil-DNA glycosylase [Litoribacter]MBS9523215.1 uracil-DNA glycosylase [Litoribacter alkaliphilus]MBT0810622.1 uracil-DNA glycosylase [Litoribacter ruber]